MEYQLDAWYRLTWVSWEGDLPFNFGWESHEDSVSIKILVTIIKLNWTYDNQSI